MHCSRLVSARVQGEGAREDLNTHVKKNSASHTLLFSSTLKDQQRQIDELRADLAHKDALISQMTGATARQHQSPAAHMFSVASFNDLCSGLPELIAYCMSLGFSGPTPTVGGMIRMLHSSTGIAEHDLPEHSLNQTSKLYHLRVAGCWETGTIDRYIRVSSASAAFWLTKPSDDGRMAESKRVYRYEEAGSVSWFDESV